MADPREAGEHRDPREAGDPREAALVTRLRALHAPVRPPLLAGAGDVGYALHDGPVGRLVIAVGAGGVLACSYDEEAAVTARLARSVSPRVLRDPRRVDPVRRELDAYFAGARQGFDLAVDLALATPFQRGVLTELGRLTGFGTTTTYGALAAALGRPQAARAVGAALGANPVCVIVPCHRVLGSSGGLTGYAGGVEAKRWLLELERSKRG